jgi:hypothetical protein
MKLSPTALLEPTARRLSALDASFLRLESSRAHMHVGRSALFEVPDPNRRPTLAALRERVAGRLEALHRCRWRLQGAPLGLSEPRWVVEDRRFDLHHHVRALANPDERVGHDRFAELRDALLSEPLDHERPPWEICLIPRLEDGRMAMVGKIHHALVDGIAALQIVGLIVDEPEQGDGVAASSGNRDRAAPSTSGPQDPLAWALDEVAHAARTGLGTARAAAGAALRPAGRSRLAGAAIGGGAYGDGAAEIKRPRGGHRGAVRGRRPAAGAAALAGCQCAVLAANLHLTISQSPGRAAISTCSAVSCRRSIRSSGSASATRWRSE